MAMNIFTPLSTPGRIIGYARVSTEDQSLALQLDALNHAQCAKIFTDHGYSGATASRPGLDETLEYLQEGDHLVVYKLDRLGRSVMNLADLLHRLREQGVHFCSLSEGINTATPGGKLIYHIFSAIAEFERDLISERTRHGLDAAKRRGAQLGRPRLLTRRLVRQAHEMTTNHGQSICTVAEHFNVSRSTLERAFDRYRLCA